MECIICFLISMSCCCSFCRVVNCDAEYAEIKDEDETSPIRREKVDFDLAASGDICSICIGNYSIDELYYILPCNHQYHVHCYDKWANAKGEDVTCPDCRESPLN